MSNPDDYKLVITYDVEAQDHNGYCSDPDKEIRCRKYKERESYPIPKTLPKEFLENETIVPFDEQSIWQFEKKTEDRHYNPACRCKIRYEMTKAKVVRK